MQRKTIILLILSIMRCFNVAVPIPEGYSPFDACRYYGYDNSVIKSEDIPNLASALKSNGINNAFIYSFNNDQNGFVLHSNGHLDYYNNSRDSPIFVICTANHPTFPLYSYQNSKNIIDNLKQQDELKEGYSLFGSGDKIEKDNKLNEESVDEDLYDSEENMIYKFLKLFKNEKHDECIERKKEKKKSMNKP